MSDDQAGQKSSSQNQQVDHVKAPHVDFSFQFNTAKEHEKVEKNIFDMLCRVSDDSFQNSIKRGALVVLGSFDIHKHNIIYGMRQIGKNPIQKFVNVITKSHQKDVVDMLSQNYDGASIVNRNGQLLSVGIYLTVDEPNLEIPEGSGTRHITAASFSTREDVQAVFTLSEENNTVRIWKRGVFVEQYDPSEVDELEEPDSSGE